MPLPKIALPTFKLELPLSKMKLECRPYLVKEDKILLMAAQDRSPSAVAQATRNVINACVVDPMMFDASDLPSQDADYLLMNIRSKSVGETVQVEVPCKANSPQDNECDNMLSVNLNLKDIILVGELPEAKIDLGEGVGVKMKPTTFRATLDVSGTDNEIDNNIAILYNSIESIYQKDDVYTTKDFTMKEFKEWVGELETGKFVKMVDYVNNLPSLRLEKKTVCSKCNKDHVIRYEDPMLFF